MCGTGPPIEPMYSKPVKESDLYLPLKRFLEAQHYEVKGEVEGCDIVAVRAQEMPVVVELKLTFNLDVILQAVDRLALTPKVYIAVPYDCRSLDRRRTQSVKLLRMLGLGLLAVAAGRRHGEVEVVIDPGEYRPRKSKLRRERLLGEFSKRVGDPNLGGMAMRKGIMTAYRQRAIAIARHLHERGPCRSAHVARDLQEPGARAILYSDVYGWFERVERGVYDLSPRGRQENVLWSRVQEDVESGDPL